jgi:hypothetical protein
MAGSLACAAAGSPLAQGIPAYQPGAQPGGVQPSRTPASAFRSDVPGVLTPPPSARDAAVQGPAVDNFRRAYQANGAPRILVFWNRALSDQVDAQRLDVSRDTRTTVTGGRIDSTTRGGSAVTTQPYGYGQRTDRSHGQDSATIFGGAAVSQRDHVSGQVQIGSGARDPVMFERDSWRFEQGFSKPFLNAGARMVDRSVAIRSTGSESAGPDIQRIEMSALKGKADILVEVLMTIDPGSASGYAFRASAKDVNSGRILADTVSDGADRAEASEYVVTNRGFESRPARGASESSGAEVGIALMSALAGAWGAR